MRLLRRRRLLLRLRICFIRCGERGCGCVMRVFFFVVDIPLLAVSWYDGLNCRLVLFCNEIRLSTCSTESSRNLRCCVSLMPQPEGIRIVQL